MKKYFAWAVFKGGKLFTTEDGSYIVVGDEKWAKSKAKTVGGEAIKVMIKER